MIRCFYWYKEVIILANKQGNNYGKTKNDTYEKPTFKTAPDVPPKKK